MTVLYNHRVIQRKWSRNWEDTLVKTGDSGNGRYCCFNLVPNLSKKEFHVGLFRDYVVSDVWGLYQLLKGREVIYRRAVLEKEGQPVLEDGLAQIGKICVLYHQKQKNGMEEQAERELLHIFSRMIRENLVYKSVTSAGLWLPRISRYAKRLKADLDSLDWPKWDKNRQRDLIDSCLRWEKQEDPQKEGDTIVPAWLNKSWNFLHSPEGVFPADVCAGGEQDAQLLLFCRFFTKCLYDWGEIAFDEPFHRLIHGGSITGKNREDVFPMPDAILRDYGCDAFRIYELFMTPLHRQAVWDDDGLEGVYRFLNRFWNLVNKEKDRLADPGEEQICFRREMAETITGRVEHFQWNTAVSSLMEFTKRMAKLAKTNGLDRDTLENAVILLSPFAPYMAEELWETLGHETSVFLAGLPERLSGKCMYPEK